MSHTPGPWTGFLDERDGHAAWLIGRFSARPIIAEVAADEECGLTGATVEANARLIAAAPELLAEAKGFIAWLQGSIGSDSDLDLATHMLKLQMAITKAEGREP